VLREIAAWQRRRGFPFIFAAEASLDLSEDEELMRLMLKANVLSVFIGVESPNEESLRETKKFQNLAKQLSILDRVHRVQAAGLEVWSGMIVGFDHDQSSIFDWQREFVRRSRITQPMVTMLFAIPKTPLYSRLASLGRLDPDDNPEFGTNVIPLRMSREELRDGYMKLMSDLYQPEEYFARVDDFIRSPGFRFAPSHAEYLRKRPVARALVQAKLLLRSLFLFCQLQRCVPDPALRQEYRRRISSLWAWRRDPALLLGYLIKCVMHLHHHTMARQMAERQSAVVNAYQ